jgi:lysophospholipase L1-like esterase
MLCRVAPGAGVGPHGPVIDMSQAPLQNTPPVCYVLGDSIMAGSAATSPELACVALLTAVYPGTVINNSASGRALYMVAETTAQRNALVAAVVAANATTFWCELAINDFVLASIDRTTLAEYTSQYSALIRALKTASPNLRIFVQSATLYTLSNTNAKGETLAQYRSAAQAACVGVKGAVYVDGLPILNASNLDGSVHPNDVGHAKLGRVLINWVDSQ